MHGPARLRIQLWSYNYDPEPTGIGPISKVFAEGLAELGHEVSVVAAHPHYPEPRWGTRVRPYREVREGIPVLRLPLWIGRETALARYRQELTFMMAQSAAAPFLPGADVLVSASPSFPALLPAILNKRARGIPWVLWLHDLLPDGATASGIVDEGSPVIRAARRLEQWAYREADRIAVLSQAFTDNLVGKGVAAGKIDLVYDPASRSPQPSRPERRGGVPRLLSMGNIGYSQGLAALVQALENEDSLTSRDVKLVITGNGVAADDVRAEIRTDKTEMLGLVDDDRLEDELQRATLAFVTQQHEGSEFNIPSKIMNFMAYGLPILAAVNPESEVARIVERSGSGWVVDSSAPAEFPRRLAEILRDREDILRKAAASRAYAEEHFTQDGFARRFDALLRDVVAARGDRVVPAAAESHVT